ncbi:MAG: metal-dependent hydrolase [bacterium]|nr:metal-dependent hydrolase [bacterium]
MMLSTHLLFGLLAGLVFVDFFDIENRILFLAIVVFSAAIPDIDTLKSKIGKKLEPFARVISLFTHRGFFHSLTALMILYIILFFLDKDIALAAFIGFLSHLILDATTKKGVMLFYPMKFKLKGFMKTGSFTEYVVMFIILAAIVHIVL